jgi:hypothetical protein
MPVCSNLTCEHDLFLIGADELCGECAKLTEFAFVSAGRASEPALRVLGKSVDAALAAMLAAGEMPLLPSARRAALMAAGLLAAARSAVADAGRLAVEHGLGGPVAGTPPRKRSPLDAPGWAGSEDFGGSDF